MLNYIGAELYKVIHRKYLYVFLGIILAAEALVVGALMWADMGGDNAGFYGAIKSLPSLLIAGVYMAVLVCDTVFSEQHKYSTLKNEVSFGIPRVRIYLGKLVTEMIVGVILLVIVVAAFLLMSTVMLPKGPKDSQALQYLGVALGGALPIYMGALGLTQLCFMSIKNNTVAAFVTAIFMTGVSSIITIVAQLDFGWASVISRLCYPYLITTPLNFIGGGLGLHYLGYAWAVGVGWYVATTAAGMLLLWKREIN